MTLRYVLLRKIAVCQLREIERMIKAKITDEKIIKVSEKAEKFRNN